ncbi:MAG: hypothetical protein C4527_10235 [Candidatus Omnitrophota bacterium]|jgi:hypothetical protein|nr:MAG: hypothetical protein C4527_10235 [Candidatus Omnitrophota bacterium]
MNKRYFAYFYNLFFTSCIVMGISFIAVIRCEAQNAADGTSKNQLPLEIAERTIPDAGDHPGNVFLEGEEITIAWPLNLTADVVAFQVLDDAGNIVKKENVTGQSPRSPLALGKLGIGWYRLDFLDKQGTCRDWTTAAVLAKLAAPTPPDSPICLDGANAWFAKDDTAKQEQYARLAALCGVNWIRDRLRWREIQPAENQFVTIKTTYDSSIEIQNHYGLQVLQVFHDIPKWAVDATSRRGRFPRDLRIAYRFCKAMSERFHGSVQAWEPWNEANAGDFGGHTIDEMCSYQKAAYLGFKAGDTTLTVGWNATAGIATTLHTKGLLENECWPYYDTYNIHTYDWPHSYESLRKPAVEAACGRPIWVTEGDRGMHYETEEPWCDFSFSNDRLKAEYIAQEYAYSLFAGADKHFHFILGHYFERRNHTQFGLLRLDLTPRPGYVALAAVGRMLAGARCLGSWNVPEQPDAHVYAFRAKPDGVERDVLVAWAEKHVDWAERGKTGCDWSLPAGVRVEGVYDYMGRSLPGDVPRRLHSSVIFVILPTGETGKLDLHTYPMAEWREGAPSPVVLQLQLPLSRIAPVKEQAWAVEYEYLIDDETEIDLPIDIYNFSNTSVHGAVVVEHLPNGWELAPDRWDLTLDSMERRRMTAHVKWSDRKGDKKSDTWIKWRGEFGEAGRPALAFRLAAFSGEGYDY